MIDKLFILSDDEVLCVLDFLIREVFEDYLNLKMRGLVKENGKAKYFSFMSDYVCCNGFVEKNDGICDKLAGRNIVKGMFANIIILEKTDLIKGDEIVFKTFRVSI